ncbi:hypothetical protein AVEN_98653-1 [Araneus ventricosus]|uniref:DDE-1 domain-containing protein n=1 Tax=Araneus ventricosus TaxID=182803 RepID=A0A4Y2EZL7_ARAVE|nr:hypothetical protein AVEN_98653-1 [Araneus ventricosus]
MTAAIFEEYFTDFDKKMAKDGRNLLVLDNATCHKHQTVLKNVKLLFLPSNMTSKLQPLDHGIIKWFKLEYRRYVLQLIIARMDDSVNASKLAKKITVANAVEWSKSVWRDLDSGLVVKCFASCGMTNSAIEKQIFSFNETKTVDEIVAGIEYDQKALECEVNLECFDDLSDNWEECLIVNVIAQCKCCSLSLKICH